MTTITNDWETHTWTLKVGQVEYDCKAFVYLTLKEVPDEYHYPPRDQIVASWNLEGWLCMPEQKPEHGEEILRQLMELLTEEYGPL